jgi:excisionase family DNA binding protein
MELKPSKHIYGISGLARLLGCSNPTAQKIKNSGKIPFVQVGRKIIFNEDKVIEALSEVRKEVQHG